MSLNLSSSELRDLNCAMLTLLSPFDFPDVDAWRRQSNRELTALLRADSAGFMLPESGSLFLYSEEHDPAELSRYPELTPPDLRNGTNIFVHMAELRVNTLENGYGDDYDLYLHSSYYNDYAGANGAHDTLAALLPLHEVGVAGIQFWHSHPTRRKFTPREIAILELIYPALRAGIHAHVTLGGHRKSLLSTIDQIGEEMLVFDRVGTVVHETPAANRMLSADAEADVLRARIGALDPTTTEAELATTHAQYRARFFRHGPDSREGLRIAMLERLSPITRSDEELWLRYALTKAEVRVAHQVALGRSNAEIAASLHISMHTVKRHVEKVLVKLGVNTRREVRSRISQ